MSTRTGANVSRYLPGGGAFFYSGYTNGTGRFAAQFDDGSILVLVSQSPITYQRLKRDGGKEIYAQSDGSTGYPRNIFLSQVIDPQGNAVTLNYDGQRRLTSLTDATGRQTTFAYELSAQPLLVTKITDPFGRSAVLAYDGYGRLYSITDVIGLTSSFGYDANALVNSLTTPYGTTTFAFTAPGTSAPPRFVQVTDPMGFSEREEWLEPAQVPTSDPAATVPQGMPVPLTNGYLEYRNSFHWDKQAYVVAGCTPTGGCDYNKARNRHFAHFGAAAIKSTTLESVKYPLENRIWFAYPGQTNAFNSGSFNQPIAMGRVLDDGTTQLTQLSYDTAGSFNLTSVVDPLGRKTSFTYANGTDLAAITQSTAYGFQALIAQFTYNIQHRPLVSTDAAGQTTFYTYNTAGQLTSVTNPLNQKTTYQYDATGRLSAVINANNVTVASFTYDGFDRVATFTDSQGWTVAYSYDSADRLTTVTYPDSSLTIYTYDKLDLGSVKDRLGRVWSYTYDANRRLTKIRDPFGNETLLAYNQTGKLTALTDAKGNVTTWAYDVQNRLTSKRYADGRSVTYTYEATTSRLKSVTDPLGQTKQFSYAKDDRVAGITYLNAVNPTPNVSFAYDTYFPRLVSMTDGTGTTQYSYVPIGSPGALKQQQEASPLPGSAITYAYDPLGRTASRAVAGSGAETFQYDTINRLASYTNDLGAFTLSYLGQTRQVTQRQLASSTLASTLSYLANSGDRRLAGISHVGLSASNVSAWQFASTPEDFITGVTETSDAATVYPTASQQTAAFNPLNQATSLSAQAALSYSATGNLLSDGQRAFAWDAEDRLVGVTWPAQPGRQVTFAYDGQGRRTTISSTPAGGGSTVTTSYVWCGESLCQVRNASNVVTRAYYNEGEFVPGAPAQRYYYGADQIGSVRRVFASTGSAPAYAYDPYGVALQGTAPLTDFGFAGMFWHTDSGLFLTQYRAYDPTLGRWLSRDPLGEASDSTANLYAYVGGNPISVADPSGLLGLPPLPLPLPPGGRADCGRLGYQSPIERAQSDFPGRPAHPGDPYHPDSVEQRRYPPLVTNPQHTDRLLPGKTPQPADYKQVYQRAVRVDERTYIGRNDAGQYYRYTANTTGTAHFTGILTQAEIRQHGYSKSLPAINQAAPRGGYLRGGGRDP